MAEVLVRRQHHQVMANTKLREQRINCPYLYALLPAVIAKARGADMVLAIGHHQWDGRKPIYDLLLGLGTVKPLEQFLQDEPRCHHALARLEGTDQRARHHVIGQLIPTQH